MIVAIRIVGVLLILLGFINLASLFAIDLSSLQSPIAVAVRYSLMCIAGIGFVLLYKWAFVVYLTSLALNWIAFFTVYDLQSVGPLWTTIPIPLVIAVLTYFAWDKLKPIRKKEVMDDA
jgi:hypothetical protein